MKIAKIIMEIRPMTVGLAIGWLLTDIIEKPKLIVAVVLLLIHVVGDFVKDYNSQEYT